MQTRHIQVRRVKSTGNDIWLLLMAYAVLQKSRAQKNDHPTFHTLID